MISIRNVTKIYPRKSAEANKIQQEIRALDRVNLKISRGEIVGIVGPNGAGKTTLLKIISTLILPDEGEVLVNGYNVVDSPREVQRIVGFSTAEFARSLYWRLTGMENMRFFASLRNIENADEKIEELVELFGMKEYIGEKVMRYSTGMKHKLALAISMLHDPQIILLDEPLTGIDPITSLDIKDTIRKKLKGDKTMIWTSNNLYEIEEMCERVVLIHKGKIVMEGKTDALKKNHWDYTKIRIVTDKPEKFESLEVLHMERNIVDIKSRNVEKTLKEILRIAEQEGADLEEIKTVKPSLEDIFMAVVKDVE